MDWKTEPPVLLRIASGAELCELSEMHGEIHEVCRAACDYTDALHGYAAVGDGERTLGFGLVVAGADEGDCSLVLGTTAELNEHAALPRMVACLAGDARATGFRWMTTNVSLSPGRLHDLLIDAGVFVASSLSVGGDSELRIDLHGDGGVGV